MNVTARHSKHSNRIRKLIIVPTAQADEEILDQLLYVLTEKRVQSGVQIYRNGAGGLEWDNKKRPHGYYTHLQNEIARVERLFPKLEDEEKP